MAALRMAPEGIIPAYAGSTIRTAAGWLGSADHPRIRGEHIKISVTADTKRGSSPHTRGARLAAAGAAGGRGIIPAYAGSTSRGRPSIRWLADHPRIRGEHSWSTTGSARGSGSSPHTRGALAALDVSSDSAPDHPRIRGEHWRTLRMLAMARGSSPHTRGAPAGLPGSARLWRIIPAYAGSTSSRRSRKPSLSDHPRIRGEHKIMPNLRRISHGSSPHTRGALTLSEMRPVIFGIIPAYAGSTPGRRWCGPPPPDHPRIRGEHVIITCPVPVARGSSPHTRGAHHPAHSSPTDTRIIPAYAGSTGSMSTRRTLRPDHPRIRGEHESTSWTNRRLSGSSPHTRGAPVGSSPDAGHAGIIPAYAGSTGSAPTTSPGRPDHPRIRGEHLVRAPAADEATGSSPHTRGAPPGHRRAPGPVRIIPAYAGSTGRPPSFPLVVPDHPRIRGEHGTRSLSESIHTGSSPHTRGAHPRGCA